MTYKPLAPISAPIDLIISGEDVAFTWFGYYTIKWVITGEKPSSYPRNQ